MRSSMLPLVAVVLVACAAEPPGPGPDAGSDAASLPDTGPVCGTGGDVPDGWPCHCDTECTAGAVCNAESLEGQPGGSCTRLCSATMACSTGAVCHTATGRCRAACTTLADCPRGRYCDNGECRVLCTADADCDSGMCNAWSGLCVTSPPTGAGVFGACTQHSDCRGGFCTMNVCPVFCRADAPVCPDGATCFVTGGTDGICSYPCPGGTCTQPGLVCVSVSGEPWCLPPGLGA